MKHTYETIEKYQCETCGTAYYSSDQITSCSVCGKDCCFECSYTSYYLDIPNIVLQVEDVQTNLSNLYCSQDDSFLVASKEKFYGSCSYTLCEECYKKLNKAERKIIKEITEANREILSECYKEIKKFNKSLYSYSKKYNENVDKILKRYLEG